MDVYVDPDLCISCGTCIDICPEIYDWDDEGRAQTTCDDIPEDLEECAQEALESCPVDAIKQTE
ncbi:MAG TPA: ferredoxin [Syntrophaceticus sp.]|uniref:Ferredoxin n=1 Tax=Syntrophaceticus schinkii TaxID=499207 RepID=A0A0B7MPG9_9FIRM|nr:ferredoxin [Syntrophaceticus schinkii]MDD2359542.1 ferredoxin [Syntrophaceticus schinkii]MDD4674705.1 ferredoxin [Syntrophaceticus schinkii]CEO89622.1 Ferredoxin [Syntrophaceticus schinkii]HHY29696.1 ferredoxin [Syntrophaceticus sp.]